MPEINAAPQTTRLSRDFWIFWAGQGLSNLGSAVTRFILPLLIYNLTGSAVDLSLAAAAGILPYPLFGLLIGAWVDRVDRKRLMIATDGGRALLIGSIPLLAAIDHLPLWWLYLVNFLITILSICFEAAEFAAVPSLVPRSNLIAANGRIQASYSAAAIIGPLLVSPLLLVVSPSTVLLLDLFSYLCSAGALLAIRRSFNVAEAQRTTNGIRHDIIEGLRYVFGHPVLRAISLMMLLINFIGVSQFSQLVYFAKTNLQATDAQVSLFYSVGQVGAVLLPLAAGRIRQRWSFGRVALGILMIEGLISIGFAFNRSLFLGIGLWALILGMGLLFNINTGSLRQAIAPNEMLGRVMSVAMVMANSISPIGAILGGIAIERTGNVTLVYALIGALISLVAFIFSFTAIGDAERYLPQDQERVANNPA